MQALHPPVGSLFPVGFVLWHLFFITAVKGLELGAFWAADSATGSGAGDPAAEGRGYPAAAWAPDYRLIGRRCAHGVLRTGLAGPLPGGKPSLPASISDLL